MKSWMAFVAAVFGVLVSVTAFGQGAATGDPALNQQLDRLGLHYSITKSGSYSLLYDLDSGRKQTAYIMGKTQTVGDTEVRELWSRAGAFDEAPSADDMQALLEESGSKGIGFWALEARDEGGYTLYFSVKVPVYLKDSDLAGLLAYTANMADEKERNLFGVDEE